jgi:excinuclease UvrABC ATPase subunit
MDLAFFDTVRTTCEACAGRRYTDAVLAHRLDGRSIADVLDLDVEAALAWLRGWERPPALRRAADRAAHDRVVDRLAGMARVGLGYLTLGQPLTTLSGGEAQRLKLAGELASTGTLYVMDEPTTGLHMADVGVLLGVIDLLVDAGNTVVVVEHDLDVVKHADWVVDLGPEGGSGGGEVVFTGTPADLARARHSVTGRHLAASLPGAAG